ncbi:MAG: hypothetical protein JO159_14220, partial [Acidobacteria bacterium]|nr:hypothetical protein [Acidobacteriota bacterium]
MQTRIGCLAICFLFILAPGTATLAADEQATENVAEEALNGEWLVTRNVYGNPLYQKLTLKLQNGKLTGSFGDSKLEGVLQG